MMFDYNFSFLLCIYSVLVSSNLWKTDLLCNIVQRLGLPEPEDLKINTKDGGVVDEEDLKLLVHVL